MSYFPQLHVAGYLGPSPWRHLRSTSSMLLLLLSTKPLTPFTQSEHLRQGEKAPYIVAAGTSFRSCMISICGHVLWLQGKKIATLKVSFATNATIYDTAPTQSDISDKVTGAGNSNSTSCADKCAIYNLTCAGKNRCWSRIVLFFTYLGIAAAIGEWAVIIKVFPSC